jgi:hypothetical protein
MHGTNPSSHPWSSPRKPNKTAENPSGMGALLCSILAIASLTSFSVNVAVSISSSSVENRGLLLCSSGLKRCLYTRKSYYAPFWVSATRFQGSFSRWAALDRHTLPLLPLPLYSPPPLLCLCSFFLETLLYITELAMAELRVGKQKWELRWGTMGGMDDMDNTGTW